MWWWWGQKGNSEGVDWSSSYGVKMGAWSCVAMVVMAAVWVTERGGQAFNVLPDGVEKFSGPPASQFGFSVALWKDEEDVKRVVVGAPRGNQTWGNRILPLGVAYLCKPRQGMTDEDACRVQPNLTPPTDPISVGHLLRLYNYTLSHYGMAVGQTVVAERGEGTRMLVCSPRYPIYNNNDLYVLNNGMCFAMDEPSSVTRVEPSFSKVFESSVSGFSAAYIENTLVMGGPSGFFDCGVVVSCPRERCRHASTRYFEGTNDKVANEKRGQCRETYQGWAVQVARFGGNSSSFTIATSSPKANNYKGQISFYPLQPTPWAEPLDVIDGSEIGAFFGYALASPDLDGDGAADLVIGVPFASDAARKLSDVGNVLIHYAPLVKNGATRPSDTLWGRDSNGRFGTSVASLGDINGDDYEDVAVGAPYAGEDGYGVVYIYNGGEDGLKSTNPKVITPSEFFPGARGFGFSLDGGVDMDGNQYHDTVIGALNSNSALLLRSSPVIQLTGTVRFRPEEIDIKTKQCEIELAGNKKMRAVCFNVQVDLQYSSRADYTELKLEYELTMSIDSKSPMMYGFKTNTHRTANAIGKINKYSRHAWSLAAFVQRSRDNLNLGVSVAVAVKRIASYEPDHLPPVLDIFTPTVYNANSSLMCGDKSNCSTKPDLVLNVTGDPVVLTDGPVTITLNIHVEVRHDPAYNIKLKIDYPHHITYKDVDSLNFIPECRKTAQGKSFIECNLQDGDTDEQIDFWVSFEISNEDDKLLLMDGTDFSLSVTNDVKDSDPDLTNNEVKLTIPAITKAKLYPRSESEPDVTVVQVNETASQEEIDAARETSASFPVDKLGPRVDHVFSLHNQGPSSVRGATLSFHVPLYLNGEPLAYFMEPPTTSEGVTCSQMALNPFGLQPPRPPATFGSSSTSSISVTDKMEEKQHGREKRDVKENTPPVTTVSSTSPSDSSTPTIDSSTYSSTFEWTTDPVEYFSTTYDSIQSRKTDRERVLDCQQPECLVTCSVDRIAQGEAAKVRFSSYLVTATLDKLGMRKVLVRTYVTPNVTQEGSTVVNPTLTATIEVTLDQQLDKGWFLVLPLWLLILTVGLGFLVVLIIFLALWKTGFFERKRPPADYDRKSFKEREATVETQMDSDL